MNHKLPFILAVVMAVAALGLFVWDRNGDAQATVEQAEPVIHEFNPPRKEFTLDDGTPCVMVWAPQRAQSSGIACDWDYKRRQNVN